jgi:CheY-like chemotaxis protein
MLNTVYVKVVGFRDAERHALNTVFRLSQDRTTHYQLWAPEAPLPPHLVLLDTESYEGGMELQSPGFNKNVKLIAVGENAPEGAWRAFTRPLNWSAVVHAMDQLFAGASGSDIDLETGEFAKGIAPPGVRQTLLVDPAKDHRLYLRARLALAGLLEISETGDALQAYDLARQRHYNLVIINLDAPEIDGWRLVERLVGLEPAIGSIVLSSRNASWHVQQRAEQAGCVGVLEVPFDPMQIMDLLRKV